MEKPKHGPVVKLQGVTKSYGSVQVLKGISFEVQPREVVCLIGPSGSGKSTTLRTINALETVDQGLVEVCGLNYASSRLSPHAIRRKTAMIFQRFELFPHLTALENTAFGPRRALKMRREEAYAIAQKLLADVGLKDHQDKYPRQLSGGQQQRVAIARALAIRPEVLLCDEPTSALDPELVQEVLDILSGIASHGMTTILVTHEMRFARKVANRTLFMDAGNIIEQGPSGEIFENPKTPRLKSFLEKLVSQ